MSSADSFETDVLIIGMGPTGATTALALAKLGIRTHMVSRSNWVADSPRAHITNQRAMEVLRDLEVEEECRRNGSPWEYMGDTPFISSLAGEELVRLRTWGTGDERRGDYMQASPCPMMDLIQPVIEPILIQAAARAGASFAFNTEYLSYVENDGHVVVQLRDLLSGRDQVVRAKYLVGADGARSKVVEDLGLIIQGQMARAGTVYTLFDADLGKFMAHRPSILNWIITPHASFGEIGLGLLRAVRPWTQWIAGWGVDISGGEPDISESTVRERIYALIGDSSVELRLQRSSVWYVNQAWATGYSKGRVFCAGDAVHRHPPSSGLGLNTCVQDGFNLGWKLAYVIKGHASSRLLDSYSLERAPIGRQVVQRANQSRLEYAPLKAAFRVAGAENPVLAGIARFRDPGPEGIKARQAVEQALALKNTEFNAQGTEMNQRYCSGAVIADPDAGEEVWKRDPELYLQATTRPGAKIPHAWLIDRQGRRVSTLDVTGKGQFTLVTGLAGHAWAEATTMLSKPYLRVVVTGALDTQDPYCEWQRRREVSEAGAVLVRPDGYVAWRHMEGVHGVEQARALLAGALEAVLG